MIRVTKKSIAITPTDPATTAFVVEMPTPCVPPVVRSPDMTGHADDHEPEDERLRQPHPDVLHIQGLEDRRPVDAARHLQLISRHNPAADDARRSRR